jgi:hypothetical protein
LERKLRDERMKAEKEEDYICEDVRNDGMKGWNCIYDVMWIEGDGMDWIGVWGLYHLILRAGDWM